MKYILTGSQSVGKSEVLKRFKDRINTVTEVVRNLAKSEGINVNESGDENGQTRIFETYYETLSSTPGPLISDRGLTDVIAYTCYNMKDKGEEGEKFLEKQIERFVQFQKENPDFVYFYIPIEFPVVNDGFRSLNEEFRREIDKNIKDFLDVMEVDYIELRGSIEERVETVENVMRNYGDIQ